ncbi:DUF2756 family protein [Cronobacter turicensis]|uniref:DUF2756 family protein n=1 Tax=Cronobacter turicensis TaxID=413502 RepID=UPI0014128B81|nr:DUF2756 family protein [Cronobacter turicensis]NHV11060.1 DUF2756 family protein [Cronobacter turicensis]NHV64712.1 DUF2756 family protein [Cronobacter turicensis]NHW11653.1 DUF2756 family protein [Cronobacter turicensis]
MKRYLLIAAALPLAALAEPINVINNPNQPGYVNPSQQRLQTQMQSQQLQQKGMLNQQIQTQSRLQQQQLQTQMNNNVERIQQNQPGNLNPPREQVLPNTNGGMLNSSSGATLNSTSQTHMIEPRQNGDMLRQNGTTLKTQNTITP